MAFTHQSSFGRIKTAALDVPAQQIVPVAPKKFDVMAGHLYGDRAVQAAAARKLSNPDPDEAPEDLNADDAAIARKKDALKAHCPHSGQKLDDIGRQFGINFEVNANPQEGFTIRIADGPEAADELTVYQILKGGYDGNHRLLAEFHRDHIDGLDDPFIMMEMFKREKAIERILGPLPEEVKPGSLQEWRELGWRDEARKIIERVNAYNPVHHEICLVHKKTLVLEVDEEYAGFHPKRDDVHMYKEDELYEVQVTPVARLPKIRYLEGFVGMLNEASHRLGFD